MDVLAALVDLPGVAQTADTARESIDRLLRHRVLRRRSSDISLESALRGARASAALDGVDVPLDELRSGEVHDPVVQGSVRVSGALGGLVRTWRQAPAQVLARLHVLAATGVASADELGRPRPDEQIGARLTALGQVVTTPTAAPGVIVASVVHGELIALEPFVAGNGVVARAAARLTTMALGVDPKSLAVPEVAFAADREAYAEAVAAYRSGSRDGVATWLRYCAAAYEQGAREGLAICEAVAR